MKFKSVLIVTYGRTGSTLLQVLLNAIPGCVVKGENFGLAIGLYQSWRSLVRAIGQKSKFGQSISDPFFGSHMLNEMRFLADARKLIKNQIIGEGEGEAPCWGFKEIRYTPMALKSNGKYDLGGFLEFLSLLMPQPAFLFLTRDHDKVLESGFWRNWRPEDALDEIKRFEEEAAAWSKEREDTFWITYESLREDSPSLDALFEFLEAETNRDAISRALLKRHSYQPRNDPSKGKSR